MDNIVPAEVKPVENTHERIKTSDNIQFKPKFIEHYKKIMGENYDKFIEYSLKRNRDSIRINTLKIDIDSCVKRIEEKGWTLTSIPWCTEGYWIKSDRRDVGNLIEHQLGYIYVQEAMSMVPPLCLEIEKDQKILDMCASPGSKTTQIGQYQENTGLLISNDVKGSRLSCLGLNTNRMGLHNNVITLQEGRRFDQANYYDRVLCDAPCSGTGTIRKSLKTLRIWNPGMVRRIAQIQKKLIETAFNCLKPGGIMVYSTCSLEPEENEAVVHFLLNLYENAQTLPIDLPMKSTPAFTSWEEIEFKDGVKNSLRVHPYDNDTDGFFVCKIKKN